MYFLNEKFEELLNTGADENDMLNMETLNILFNRS